jgi:RND family efflux transporter MFP subunit
VEAEYRRWESEYARITELAEKHSVTQKLAEETLQQKRAAEAGRTEVEAKVKAAQAAARQAEVQVAKAEADLRAIQANARVTEADLDRAKTMLGYLTIAAPFDGVVVRRNVDTGHFVSSANGGNGKSLLAVARTDVLRIVVDVPETEAPLIDAGANGDKAIIRSQAVGDREIEARVTRTAWSLDESNRSLRVEIHVPNTGDLFRPGMFATVKILLDARDNVLIVPATAVLVENDERFCLCVNDGKIVRKPVKVGLRASGDCEILEGLTEGDLVVRSRADTLKPDQPVEVNPSRS